MACSQRHYHIIINDRNTDKNKRHRVPLAAAGVIYCSPITARLVHQRLKVPMGRLHILPLHSPIQVAGVTVTFVDAHHCPGAVMILFEAPGRLPLLHTGDCRSVSATSGFAQMTCTDGCSYRDMMRGRWQAAILIQESAREACVMCQIMPSANSYCFFYQIMHCKWLLLC